MNSDPLSLPIKINQAALHDLCKKWHVRDLAVFGSVLRPDFSDTSDIDVLVSFEPKYKIGFAFMQMEKEMAAVFGRDVDLVTRRSIQTSHNWIRRHEILSTAKWLYIA